MVQGNFDGKATQNETIRRKKSETFFLQILKFMSVKRKRPLPSRNCSRQTCFLDKRPCDTLSALVNRTQVRLLGKEGVSNSICFSFFFVKRRWQSVSALENRFISQSRVKKHQGHVLMVPKRLEGPGFKGKRPRAERLSNSERPGKRYFFKRQKWYFNRLHVSHT